MYIHPTLTYQQMPDKHYDVYLGSNLNNKVGEMHETVIDGKSSWKFTYTVDGTSTESKAYPTIGVCWCKFEECYKWYNLLKNASEC